MKAQVSPTDSKASPELLFVEEAQKCINLGNNYLKDHPKSSFFHASQDRARRCVEIGNKYQKGEITAGTFLVDVYNLSNEHTSGTLHKGLWEIFRKVLQAVFKYTDKQLQAAILLINAENSGIGQSGDANLKKLLEEKNPKLKDYKNQPIEMTSVQSAAAPPAPAKNKK